VDIWQEAELSGSFSVDANGTVVLPLLGEREVTGVPVSELERNLANEYREFLENPSVRVTVLRRIAVFGEVRNPNLYMVDATITLRDLLAMAGGVLPSGKRDEIRLLRDDQVLISSLDLNRQIGETPIQSGDQIEVGQQGWAYRNRTWLTAVLGAVTTVTVAYIWSR
jgi:polysaccharide export outer membrane protein